MDPSNGSPNPSSAIQPQFRYLSGGGGPGASWGRYLSGGNNVSWGGSSYLSGGYQDPWQSSMNQWGRPQDMVRLTQSEQAAKAAAATQAGGTQPSAGGNEWATLDALDDAYASASSKTGVPANLIKAVNANESGFGQNGLTPVFFKGTDGRPDFYVIPFSGIKQATAESWGLDWNRLQTDKAYNIEAMGMILNGLYNSPLPEGGTVGSKYGWNGAISMYFLGTPQPTGKADELGNVDTEYVARVAGMWNDLDSRQLDASAGLGGAAPSYDSYGVAAPPQTDTYGTAPAAAPQAGPVASMGLTSIWGGDQNVYVSQGFGTEDNYWSTPDAAANNYNFAADYGLPAGHPGVDYSMAIGTPLYAPVGGTVTVVGQQTYDIPSGQYGWTDAFYEDNNGGVGQVRIKLDNGDEIILGHCSTSMVKPGQRIDAGMLVALSGTGGTPESGGPHLHLEVRVVDPTQKSGFRIVDPRIYFGG